MEWSKKLILENSFIERDLGDEVVLMSSDGQEIHSFEDTAFWIWKKIKEGITPDKIISELIDEYDVEEESARKDFIDFILDLKKKGILKQT